ncbi:hypothetical protein FRB90_012591 [Tulasnella sp. 427]|nr:hypothetical protein FRB90_012591 [Tulasnella sp. 427]
MPGSRSPLSAASAPGEFAGGRRSPRPSTSPSPSPRPPLSSQLPGVVVNRTSKAERRSVSASNVEALVMQANRLAAGHFALAERIAEAVPHTPMEDINVSEDHASGEGEITMFLDVREDTKGKGRATPIEEEDEPVSPAPPNSQFQQQQPATASASVSRNGSKSGPSRPPPQIVIPLQGNSSGPAASSSPRTPHTGSSVASGGYGTVIPSLPTNRPRQGSEDSATSEKSIRSDTSAKSPRGAPLPGQPTLSIVREDGVILPPPSPSTEQGPSAGKGVAHSPSLPSLKNPATMVSHHLRNSPSLPNGSAIFTGQPETQPKSDSLEAPRDPSANGLLRNSFSKPPRPAPLPNPNTPPTAITNPSPPANYGTSAPSVAPLKLTKPPPSAIPPATSAYLKRRERSSSDSAPLSPRLNLQRSSSVSEVPSPPSGSGSPQGSQAPSSFGAAFSRAFVSLKRKKSDQSIKGKESDREDQEKLLDHQLPNEAYRLELLREDIKARYKFHVRRRRVLLRSLHLYIDGSDPETAKRLTEELAESSEACDRLTEELFQVTDQLAQMSQITQRHNASALSMALRKLNTSFIKAKGETIDSQLQVAMLEAERDEAWAVAESVERELNHYKQKHGVAEDFLASPLPHHAPPSSWASRQPGTSRVSAARKTSTRASKASLRMSRRSARSSASSGVRFGAIIPPSSSSSGSVSGASLAPSKQQDDGSSSSKSPSVPPVPSLKSARRASERSFSSYTNSHSHSRRASIAGTPSTASRAMAQAQSELFEMLGIPQEDIDRQRENRRRSYSAPSSPTSSDGRKMRRVSLPSTSSLLESPSVIAAMLSLPSANT